VSNYKKEYGINMGRQGPDFSRCCVEVSASIGLHTSWYQCNRKRGHGPNGDYCKQHDPDAVKARSDKSRAAYLEKINKERYGWHGKKFYNVLKQIAEGHNDARGLARETIAEFEAGAYK
jgi:hypothetical protein